MALGLALSACIALSFCAPLCSSSKPWSMLRYPAQMTRSQVSGQKGEGVIDEIRTSYGERGQGWHQALGFPVAVDT